MLWGPLSVSINPKSVTIYKSNVFVAVGFLYDRVDFMLTASICMAITTVLTAAMPHVYELYSLLTVFFLNGGFLGFFEAGANMQLLHLWGKGILISTCINNS